MDPQRFTVTNEHLILMRRMYVGWCYDEFGAPEIDPKRPYGNSDVLGDIHELLTGNGSDGSGSDLPDDVKNRYEALHLSVKTALQIALATGTFESGDYEAPAYTVAWRKV